MERTKVIGISYDPATDSAPLVMLKGSGGEAQHILDAARRSGDVPVVSDPELAAQLYRLPLDSPIGKELFPVMAALLAHVIHIDRQQGDPLP
jgi:type III secretion system FlhB-like substrate exporter